MGVVSSCLTGNSVERKIYEASPERDKAHKENSCCPTNANFYSAEAFQAGVQTSAPLRAQPLDDASSRCHSWHQTLTLESCQAALRASIIDQEDLHAFTLLTLPPASSPHECLGHAQGMTILYQNNTSKAYYGQRSTHGRSDSSDGAAVLQHMFKVAGPEALHNMLEVVLAHGVWSRLLHVPPHDDDKAEPVHDQMSTDKPVRKATGRVGWSADAAPVAGASVVLQTAMVDPSGMPRAHGNQNNVSGPRSCCKHHALVGQPSTDLTNASSHHGHHQQQHSRHVDSIVDDSMHASVAMDLASSISSIHSNSMGRHSMDCFDAHATATATAEDPCPCPALPGAEVPAAAGTMVSPAAASGVASHPAASGAAPLAASHASAFASVTTAKAVGDGDSGSAHSVHGTAVLQHLSPLQARLKRQSLVLSGSSDLGSSAGCVVPPRLVRRSQSLCMARFKAKSHALHASHGQLNPLCIDGRLEEEEGTDSIRGCLLDITADNPDEHINLGSDFCGPSPPRRLLSMLHRVSSTRITSSLHHSNSLLIGSSTGASTHGTSPSGSLFPSFHKISYLEGEWPAHVSNAGAPTVPTATTVTVMSPPSMTTAVTVPAAMPVGTAASGTPEAAASGGSSSKPPLPGGILSSDLRQRRQLRLPTVPQQSHGAYEQHAHTSHARIRRLSTSSLAVPPDMLRTAKRLLSQQLKVPGTADADADAGPVSSCSSSQTGGEENPLLPRSLGAPRAGTDPGAAAFAYRGYGSRSGIQPPTSGSRLALRTQPGGASGAAAAALACISSGSCVSGSCIACDEVVAGTGGAAAGGRADICATAEPAAACAGEANAYPARTEQAAGQVDHATSNGGSSDGGSGSSTCAPTRPCWHEVTAKVVTDPVTGSPALMLVQRDVSRRAELEGALASLTEKQLVMLSQIFPRHVVEFLSMQAGATPDGLADLAREHKSVTLLFMDVVSFTSMAKCVSPQQVMSFLNSLFSLFDALCDVHGVHKVETAGDAYIVSSGVLEQDEEGFYTALPSHDPVKSAGRVMEFAKDMLAHARTVAMPHTGEPVQIRIGLHTGDVYSGVVGSKLPKFSLFGDAMNTASRMETTSKPCHIHVSAATRSLLPDESWEPTQGVMIKGKGVMETYLWMPPPGFEDQHPMPPPLPPPPQQQQQQQEDMVAVISIAAEPPAVQAAAAEANPPVAALPAAVQLTAVAGAPMEADGDDTDDVGLEPSLLRLHDAATYGVDSAGGAQAAAEVATAAAVAVADGSEESCGAGAGLQRQAGTPSSLAAAAPNARSGSRRVPLQLQRVSSSPPTAAAGAPGQQQQQQQQPRPPRSPALLFALGSRAKGFTDNPGSPWPPHRTSLDITALMSPPSAEAALGDGSQRVMQLRAARGAIKRRASFCTSESSSPRKGDAGDAAAAFSPVSLLQRHRNAPRQHALPPVGGVFAPLAEACAAFVHRSSGSHAGVPPAPPGQRRRSPANLAAGLLDVTGSGNASG